MCLLLSSILTGAATKRYAQERGTVFGAQGSSSEKGASSLAPLIEQVSLMNYRVKQVDEINYFRYVLTQKNPH